MPESMPTPFNVPVFRASIRLTARSTDSGDGWTYRCETVIVLCRMSFIIVNASAPDSPRRRESVTKGMQSQQLANLPLLFVEPRLAKATTVWSSKNWPLAVRPLPPFQHLESSGSQGNVPRFGVLAVSRTDCKIAVFHAVSGLKPDIWSTQPEQFAHAKPIAWIVYTTERPLDRFVVGTGEFKLELALVADRPEGRQASSKPPTHTLPTLAAGRAGDVRKVARPKLDGSVAA